MKWFCGLLLALVLCAVMCSDASAFHVRSRRNLARSQNVPKQKVVPRPVVFVQPQAVFVPHQQFFVRPSALPFVLQQGFCR